MKLQHRVAAVFVAALIGMSSLLGATPASAGDVAPRLCDLLADTVACARADLSGRNLRGVRRRADLRRARLGPYPVANVTGVTRSTPSCAPNCAGANLAYADLTNANLTQARLAGANTSGVIWTGATCPNMAKRSYPCM